MVKRKFGETSKSLKTLWKSLKTGDLKERRKMLKLINEYLVWDTETEVKCLKHDQVTQISSTVAGEVESDKYNFNKGRSEIIEVKKKLIGNNIMLNGVVLELGWSISKGAKAQIKSEINMEESKEADKDWCKQ